MSNFSKTFQPPVPELKTNGSFQPSFNNAKSSTAKEGNARRASFTPEDRSDVFSLKTTTASNIQSLKTQDFNMNFKGVGDNKSEISNIKTQFSVQGNQLEFPKSKFANDFPSANIPGKNQKENEQPGIFFPPNSFLRDPNTSTQTANFDGGMSSGIRTRENIEGSNIRPMASKYLPTSNSSFQNILRANERPFSQMNMTNPTTGSNVGNYKKNVLAVQADLMNYDEDFLPEDCLFLLGEEDNNLASFRENVEKEKAKMASDMEITIKDVMNIFEEQKVKLQENIDLHYKNYISKYGYLKELLIEFKNMKLDIPPRKIHPTFNIDLSNSSNSNLIRDLEDLRYQNQMSKMFNYITALQREKLSQIINLSKELLQLSTQVPNYYNGEAFGGFLKELKGSISGMFTKRMQNINDFVKSLLPKLEVPQMMASNLAAGNDMYGTSHQNIMMTNANINMAMSPPFGNTMMSNNPLMSTNVNPQFASPFPLGMPPNNSSNPQFYGTSSNNFFNDPSVKPGAFQEELKTYESKFQSLSNNLYKNSGNSQNLFSKPQKLSAPRQESNETNNQIICKSVSSDKLAAKVSFLPSQVFLELSHIFKTNHDDIILCLQAVTDDLLAVGSKDATISLWRISTKSQIGVLEGHKGSICSLASIKTSKNCYLLSGSDHEDGSIIVWDLQNTNKLEDCLITRLVGHNAAVVALLSLSDGQTVISGSYDKEILVWNIYSSKAVQKLAGHNSSITALTITKDQNKFISASLDNTLNVWRLNYKEAMGSRTFESCYLERTIKNNTFVCTLNSLSDNRTVITGGKDGKIKFWNMENGECDRVLTANLGPIVELLILDGSEEATTKKEALGKISALSCSSKDQNIVLTNAGTGANSVLDTQSKVFIEYGCGVNPKLQFLKRGEDLEVILINQSEREKVFSLWNVRMS